MQLVKSRMSSDHDAEGPVAPSASESDQCSPRSETKSTTASTANLPDEIKSQLRIVNPTILGMLLYKLPWLWSLHFVAELGSDALAAAALATTICNVTGMSLAVGLAFGLATLAGQAKGDLLRRGEEIRSRRMKREDEVEEKKEEDVVDESDPLLKSGTSTINPTYGGDEEENATITEREVESLEDIPIQPLVFLFRGLFVQMLFAVPIGLWWIRGIEPALLFLGQGAQLSRMTETYLRILTPGLWCYSVNFTFTAWLQSVDMANVPPYACLAGFVLHIPTNVLFVRVLGFGYEGVAMATVAFQMLQPVITCAYLFGTARGRGRMLECTGAKGIGRTRLSFRREILTALSSPSGVWQYLVLSLPGVVVITEWWASEVCILLAGRLEPDPAYALGAMSIYQSINSFCFMFPIGFSAAASARVGMFLGKADPARAKLASFVSMAGATTLSAVMGCVLWFVPHGFFPWLFTPDPNVISETGSTIPFLAVYVFADGMQTTLNGILKGCGMQAVAMPIVMVSYWCVGVPLAYYLAFDLNDGASECRDSRFCGLAGLVAGMTLGTWTHFVLLLIAVLATVNWRREADKAQERVSLEKKI